MDSQGSNNEDWHNLEMDSRSAPAPSPPQIHFTPAQLYETLPIPSSHSYIRVLDLDKGSSSSSRQLTGTLRVVDLRTCPRFATLSYVWGSSSIGAAENAPIITCNGHILPITQSCQDALLALQQQHRRRGGDITIWVDAICINQADDSEKSMQIPLMEEIYTWAEVVYVWLGPGSDVTENAIECISRASIFRVFPAGVPWQNGGKGKGVVTMRREKFSFVARMLLLFHRQCSPMPDFKRFRQSFDVNSVLELLDQEWLRRIWTYQEIVLSSNPVILCGDRQISWIRLQEGLDYMGNFKIPPPTTYSKRTDLAKRDRLASSQAFVTWQELFRIWTSISRPSRWNGREFRTQPLKDGLSDPKCSVDDYLRFFNPRRIWLYTKLVITVFYIAVLVATVVLFFLFLIFKQGLISAVILDTVTISAFIYSASIVNFMVWYRGLLPFTKDADIWAMNTTDSSERVYLVGLIQAIRDRQSSVLKDRVFALHGVLQRLGFEAPTPDYGKSVGQVYWDFFASLIAWEPSLINLLIDTGSLKLADAPSWVPDWSTVQERTWVPSSYVYDFVEQNEWPAQELGITVSGKALSLSGVLLDTAKICSGPFAQIKLDDDGFPRQDIADKLLPSLQFFVRWLSAIKRDMLFGLTHESISHTILDILRGRISKASNVDDEYGRAEQPERDRILDFVYSNRVNKPTKVGQKEKNAFKNWYRILSNHYTQNELERGEPGTSQVSKTVFNDILSNQSALKYTIFCCSRLSSRRGLFFSNDGRAGSGPEDMEEGDWISILKGVAVPMVLRRSDNGSSTYRILGPAFVPGFMNLDRSFLENPGFDWTTITLV